MLVQTALALVACSSLAHAWLPWERELPLFNTTARLNAKRTLPPTKMRGVNLGSWLVSEPWMMGNSWSSMGCGYDSSKDPRCQASEFDCMLSTNKGAQSAFENHWKTWITPSDLDTMHGYGLNTIRIPVGYWIYRDIVYDSEPFATGQLQYLDAVIAKAAALGMFTIIDLHGAPYAQKVNDAFTGQCAGSAGFYSSDQYARATKWLTWMTNRIHSTPSYRATVGILEVVNEPQTSRDENGQPSSETSTLTQKYYPQALAAVRAAERSMNIAAANALHVQFMDDQWGAGNPRSNLPSDNAVAFDDHNYVGGAVTAIHADAKQGDYMYYSCYTDNRETDGDDPKFVQEWSLIVNNQDSAEFAQSQTYFYQSFFKAQQQLYEKTLGWSFWSWKTELGDFRWTYSDAVSKGIIPNSASGLDASAQDGICNAWFG